MTVCNIWHDRCHSRIALQKAIEVMCVVPKRCNDMMNVGRLQGFEVKSTATFNYLPLGVSALLFIYVQYCDAAVSRWFERDFVVLSAKFSLSL